MNAKEDLSLTFETLYPVIYLSVVEQEALIAERCWLYITALIPSLKFGANKISLAATV